MPRRRWSFVCQICIAAAMLFLWVNSSRLASIDASSPTQFFWGRWAESSWGMVGAGATGSDLLHINEKKVSRLRASCCLHMRHSSSELAVKTKSGSLKADAVQGSMCAYFGLHSFRRFGLKCSS